MAELPQYRTRCHNQKCQTSRKNKLKKFAWSIAMIQVSLRSSSMDETLLGASSMTLPFIINNENEIISND